MASLPEKERELVKRAELLSQSSFAPRAQMFDEEMRFPTENFTDLFNDGLMAVSIDEKYGGEGLLPTQPNVFSLWCMTREIAKVDLSFARCWEGHNNALMILNALANDEQKERWFTQVIEKGSCWAAWSGEPQSQTPGQTSPVGTCITRRKDGYVLSGNKLFATSAPGADQALLLVSLQGPGGAREAKDGENSLLLLACNLNDDSISFDDSWWDPIGMRSTVSYKVNFDQTFIPDTDCIGEIGAYISQGFQSYLTPHYAASFLGAAEGAFDYALDYVVTQGKHEDPYVQHHIAIIKMNLETVDLWLRRVADDLSSGDTTLTRTNASKVRYLAEQLTEDCVKRCIKVCGARSLNKPSHLEKTLRDLSMYVLHDNADHVLATIGRGVLNLPTDESFFKLKT